MRSATSTGRLPRSHVPVTARTRSSAWATSCSSSTTTTTRGGIFGELFGAANAAEFVGLRTARRFDEARALGAGCGTGLRGARLTAAR